MASLAGGGGGRHSDRSFSASVDHQEHEAPDLIATMRSVSLSDCSMQAELGDVEYPDVFDEKESHAPQADAPLGVRARGGSLTTRKHEGDGDQEARVTRQRPASCDLLAEAAPRRSSPSHLVAQIETLNAALRQKDALIANLQTQLYALCGQRQSREAEREARRREQNLLQQRTSQLQQQIDSRRAHLKSARLTIETIDTVDRNIDDCIRRAELEYHLETEELHILGLQEEQQRLKARLDGVVDSTSATPPAVSLSSCLPSQAEVTLHVVSLAFDPEAPSFTLTPLGGADSATVLVDWAAEHCPLRKGDRLVEVNGEYVLGRPRPTLQRLCAEAGSPLRLLAVRCRTASVSGRRAAALREQMAVLAGRLELKAAENKRLHAEQQRCRSQNRTYQAESERLQRRAELLEQRVQQLQAVLDKIRGVTDETRWDTTEGDAPQLSSASPAPPRGPHTATISVNSDSEPPSTPETPCTPAQTTKSLQGSCASLQVSVSSSQTSDSSLPSPVAPARSAPAAGTARRSAAPAPPVRSLSHESAFWRQPRPRLHQRGARALLHRLQQLGERRLQLQSATLQPARAPRKPARHSLQRAASLQTLDSSAEEALLCRPAVQTWPSMDGNLEAAAAAVRCRSRLSSAETRHLVTSLPRPGRAGSLSAAAF